MKKFLLLVFLLLSFTTFSQSKDDKAQKTFEGWDSNEDKKLSVQEFVSSLYNYFDQDLNKEVDRDEWEKGSKILSPADTIGIVPGESEALEIEYGSAPDSLIETTVPGTSKAMTRRDFYKKLTIVFRKWDDNNNNYIEQQEFDNHWLSK